MNLGYFNRLRIAARTAILCGFVFAPGSYAQETLTGAANMHSPKLVIRVSEPQQNLRMVINTSHILEMAGEIPKVNVHNPEVLTAVPISGNQVQISAKKTGVTQIDLFSDAQAGGVATVQVVVTGDARELEGLLASQFPQAQLTVTSITNGCIINGVVTSDEHVEQVISIAELYYPTIINRISVLGVRTVLLHTQVMEVSRTKLRELGIDWSFTNANGGIQQSVSGVIGSSTALPFTPTGAAQDTLAVGLVNDGRQFFGLIKALRQNDLIKVLAEPTIVAVDGRPASFNSGGQFATVVPAGLGQVAVQFQEFGTRLDFVAKVRSEGRIWLEVRPTVSEVDPTRGVSIQGITVPGLRSRFVETAVEMRAGQTLAIAGLLQVRTETINTGIPFLSDLPYVGVPFRKVRELQNEVEMLVTVTPDFAEAMDPHEVPNSAPGLNSESPTDKELYMKGHTEVPLACPPGTGMNNLYQTTVIGGMPGPGPGMVENAPIYSSYALPQNATPPSYTANNVAQPVQPYPMQAPRR